jgi:hypothetical protein
MAKRKLTAKDLDGVPIQMLIDAVKRSTKSCIIVRTHHSGRGVVITDGHGAWHEHLGLLEAASDSIKAMSTHGGPLNGKA